MLCLVCKSANYFFDTTIGVTHLLYLFNGLVYYKNISHKPQNKLKAKKHNLTKEKVYITAPRAKP